MGAQDRAPGTFQMDGGPVPTAGRSRVPGQTRSSTRRMVAALGAIRTAKAPTTRVPGRASVVCEAAAAPCPIAVYERAPATTADAAISSTLTNG